MPCPSVVMLGYSSPACVPPRTPEDFSKRLAHALNHEPKPMLAADYMRLTWEDATERFLDVTELSREERSKPLEAAFDTFAYTAHNAFNGAPSLLHKQGGGREEGGRACLFCRM